MTSPERYSHRRSKSALLRLGVVSGLIALVGLVFLAVDLTPDLSAMRVTLASGPHDSEDYALAARLAATARRHHGTLINIATAGAGANLAQLGDTTASDRLDFALALDGLDYTGAADLEVAARIPAMRTLFILGPDADAIHTVADLTGRRIGIGAKNSATNLLATELLGSAPLQGLRAVVSDHAPADQLALLGEHRLDLGLFLVDSDDPLIRDAMVSGLQMVGLDNSEALASRLPALRVTTIYPGQIDLVLGLPQTAKRTFQTGVLMLTHRGVSRSKKMQMLGLLDATFKEFIDLNRNVENRTGLDEIADLKSFVQNGGPSLLDQYAPRLLDIMPPANLLHAVVVISLLMNAMTFVHRFRLWRIDHDRIQLEEQALALFPGNHTVMEIALLTPKPGAFDADHRRRLDALIDETRALRQHIRRHSVAFVVPMGSEMFYRTQESLVDGQLRALRRFRERLVNAPEEVASDNIQLESASILPPRIA
jgi:TRAP-type uncharacterized transport system substrate-binding protein